MKRCHPKLAAGGFTLVELLVVITIIAVLAGIAIPVIGMAQRKARATVMRTDVDAIERGVEAYAGQYGDLPPDFSSWTVVNRHLNKAFPRISAVDRTLLFNMVHTPLAAPSNTPPSSGHTFTPTAIDRSEALVLFLGGLSSDETQPFTGPGGPLEYVATSTAPTDKVSPANYQYNTNRSNAYVDFDVERLTISQLTNPAAPPSPSNRVLCSLDGDLVPSYLSGREGAPYIYFDSRTYGFITDGNLASTAAPRPFNGYSFALPTDPAPRFGVARPYKRKVAGITPKPPATYSAATAPEAMQWHNPDTYQVLCAGLDHHYGNIAFDPRDSSNTVPAYFLTDTGEAIGADPGMASGVAMLIPGLSKFQERSISSTYENTQLDNITNFSKQLTLEDNLP